MQTSTPGKNKKLVLQELQFKVAVREKKYFARWKIPIATAYKLVF